MVTMKRRRRRSKYILAGIAFCEYVSFLTYQISVCPRSNENKPPSNQGARRLNSTAKANEGGRGGLGGGGQGSNDGSVNNDERGGGDRMLAAYELLGREMMEAKASSTKELKRLEAEKKKVEGKVAEQDIKIANLETEKKEALDKVASLEKERDDLKEQLLKEQEENKRQLEIMRKAFQDSQNRQK